ncbi:MAG: paraquat-inducible protein A [Lentimicrobiaceae bacterium]|jgi:uncharacterized paraquat-inducible protein A|nr:paraquat-inducible protein A [Lentimicrobiaceae bacterium]
MNPRTKKIMGIVALVFSIAFFGLGLYFPLLSTHTQVIFRFNYEKVTVFRSVAMFFEDKEYFLAGVILVFTVIMPVANYGRLIWSTISHRQSRPMWKELDKWNMLDVFLVALLLLNFKMNSNIIVMELQVGTTFIALAVIFRILVVSFMLKK